MRLLPPLSSVFLMAAGVSFAGTSVSLVVSPRLRECVVALESLTVGLSDDLTYRVVFDEAVRLSALWHDGQTRENGNPFSVHYQDVESVLEEFGFGPGTGSAGRRMKIVARLHDVVEKTPQTVDSLQEHFGLRIASMVGNLTPVENKITTFQQARRETETTVIKLADRIANMRSYHRSGISPAHYLKDYPLMKHILQRPGEAESMWKELDYLVENSQALANQKKDRLE